MFERRVFHVHQQSRRMQLSSKKHFEQYEEVERYGDIESYVDLNTELSQMVVKRCYVRNATEFDSMLEPIARFYDPTDCPADQFC